MPQDAAKPSISVCLIAKDEEKYLANCLQSVLPAADEVIVVDTGSRDKTVEIATRLGAKVFYFAWRDDFAAARNFAKDKATGEWILQIDADEELFSEDRQKVRHRVQNSPEDILFVAIHNKSSSIFGANQPVIHYLPRLFRNRSELFYENPVHENLVLNGRYRVTDIRMLHHGYDLDENSLAEKKQRNTAILQKKIRNDPDDPAAHFYLSQHYLHDGAYELARKHALHVVDVYKRGGGRHRNFYLMALNNLAIVALEEKQYAEVQRLWQVVESIDKRYCLPQFFCGVSYFREGRFEKAQLMLQDFVQNCCTGDTGTAFYDHAAAAYLFQAYHLLGKIHRGQGELEKAEKLFRQAVRLNPNFWIGYADLGYLYMERQEVPAALGSFDRAFRLAKANPAVNPENAGLWKDFQNMCKVYVQLLRKEGASEVSNSNP